MQPNKATATTAAAFDAAATAMDRAIPAAYSNSAYSSTHRQGPIDAPSASEVNQMSNDNDDFAVYHDDRSDLYTPSNVSTTLSRQLDNGVNSNVENANRTRDCVRGSGENDSSLFRLPNGQVITSKNTIQSHVPVLANDRVIVKGVGASPHKNENLFRLPNGQVITPKNTIPSSDSHGDSGRRHRQGRDGTNHAAALDSARHLARHRSNTNRHDVEATPIFVDAYPQPSNSSRENNRNPTVAALVVNSEQPAEGLADDIATNITTTNTAGGDTNTQNAGGTNRYKKLGARLAIVVLVLTVTVLTTLLLSASRHNASTTTSRDASPPSLPQSSLRSLVPTVMLPSKSPAAVVPTPTVSQSPAVTPSTSRSSARPHTPTVVPSAPIAPSFQSPLVALSSPPTITLEPSFLPPTSNPPSTEIQSPESTLAPSDGVVKPSRRATMLTSYINEIKLSNDTLAVPTSYTTFDASTSSELAALSWLVYEDPLQLSAPNRTNDNDAMLQQFRLQQRYAILTLLLQFSDFEATNTSDNECQWLSYAVTCVASTEPTTLGAYVATELYLIGLSTALGSTLSPDLGLLSHLVAVTIADTGLTGSLPSTLGVAWTNLELFDVSYNALTGSLPSALGTSWTNLERFYVLSNALNASLPSALGTTWTNLASFDVSNNALTGSLPSLLGTTWSNLTTFGASNNTLNGSLSSSLGATWTQLETFEVHENTLTGTIPNDLARHWNKLQSAEFYNNSLAGFMPSEFCTVGTLSWLSADCNSDEVTCPCCDSCCSDATGTCE